MAQPNHHAHRKRAMTLTELLIAAAITALIGAGVTAMLVATSYGTTSRAGLRRVLVQNRTTLARIDAALRAAHDLAAVGPTYLILWTDDDNTDETRQHNELQLIEWTSADSRLCSYRDPTDTAVYSDPAAFRAAALAGYPTECWATGVSSASFDLIAPSADDAPLVTYQITAIHDNSTDTAIGASATPNAALGT